MTVDEFNQEMRKASNVWGDKHFPVERKRIIFNMMRKYTREEFASIVGDLISTERWAPMVDKWSEASEKIDRIRRARYKTQSQADAQEFWGSNYHDSEIEMIMQAVKKRINDDISEEDWKAIVDSVRGVADQKRGCQICQDGLVFMRSKGEHGYRYVFKCLCAANRPESIPTYSRELENHYENVSGAV